MHTIELFMWGYQSHFQIAAKVAAKGIFNQLDNELFPKVFLVGILKDDREDRHPVCLEPEDCGFNVSQFSNINEIAQNYLSLDENRNVIHTHPIAQKQQKRMVKLRAIRNAVQEIIRQNDDSSKVISYCSWPTLVEDYRVMVILQLNNIALESHYSLLNNENNGYSIKTSLLDAAITEFLSLCSRALNKPNPGMGIKFDKDYDEVIQAAGNQLMYTPASAGNDFFGLHNLFETCNMISSMRYEGEEGIGKLLIARKGHPNIEETITLEHPVILRDYRAVRKLLEISSDEESLLSDSAQIYALGKINGEYKSSDEDLFSIHFNSHYTWELLHDSNILMRVNYRQPELPKPKFDKDKFESDLNRIFSNINSTEILNLWKITQEATKQKHGTMLVITTGAKNEANRLENQATIIKPIQLTPKIMKIVSAIDGAVIIEPNSTCYAIGVILDGLATKKGTPSRGARYNSAIRYEETINYPCFIIVVSEDVSIDFIPDLMPQISRKGIFEALENLRKINNDDNFDLVTFNKTMNWISGHEFYLLPEMCSEINKLKEEISEIRDRIIEPTILRPVFPNFIPNEDMDETYFLDE